MGERVGEISNQVADLVRRGIFYPRRLLPQERVAELEDGANRNVSAQLVTLLFDS